MRIQTMIALFERYGLIACRRSWRRTIVDLPWPPLVWVVSADPKDLFGDVFGGDLGRNVFGIVFGIVVGDVIGKIGDVFGIVAGNVFGIVGKNVFGGEVGRNVFGIVGKNVFGIIVGNVFGFVEGGVDEDLDRSALPPAFPCRKPCGWPVGDVFGNVGDRRWVFEIVVGNVVDRRFDRGPCRNRSDSCDGLFPGLSGPKGSCDTGDRVLSGFSGRFECQIWGRIPGH
jgi:hypothetical protein